jgi:hypothetical protein
MPTHLVRVGKIARSSRAKIVLGWRAILLTLPPLSATPPFPVCGYGTIAQLLNRPLRFCLNQG